MTRTARLRQPLAVWGMWIAHLGFALCLSGVCLTSHYSLEKDVRMAVGDAVEVGDYRVVFDGVRDVRGPNYLASEGTLRVFRGDDVLIELHPQKRRYLAGGNVMTEAAIDPGFSRDIYIALGEPVADGAWAVRIHVKPAVRWVWFGGLMIALGGVLAVCDARYRRRVRSPARARARAIPAGAAT